MKGYVFVPLPDAPRLSAGMPEQMRLDRRLAGHWFGHLALRLICSQSVHVGSGHKRQVDERAVRETARSAGHVCIPGSTIKGVTRARFEAITASCAHWLPREGRVASRSRPHVQQAYFTAEVKAHPAFAACRRDAVCPACALFGFQARSEAQLSRLVFSDLVASADVQPDTRQVPAQYGPRLHHLGDERESTHGGRPSFEVSTLHGRKFAVGPTQKETSSAQTVEVVPEGTVLSGTIGLFNVTDGELGGLLSALGVHPRGSIKVGGAKAYGLGRGEIEVETQGLRDALRRPRPWRPDEVRGAFEASSWRFEAGERTLFAVHEGAQV